MADGPEDSSTPEVSEAAQNAARWIEQWARENSVDLDALSGGQWFVVAMQVPCSIRCWRVGVSIPVGLNEKCPECGKVNAYTAWDRLRNDDGI